MTEVSTGDRSGGRSREGGLGQGLGARAGPSQSKQAVAVACFLASRQRISLKAWETGGPEHSFPVSWQDMVF